MKQTKNEAQETGIKNLPLGYARPDEKKARIRFEQNLKRLPKSIANIKRSQKEAARNGLTEEILNQLLTEDAA